MSMNRLETLYRRFGPAIYERCRRLLKNDAAAEDATQVTFMKAHKHLDGAPDGARAYAWLFRIATNVCLNELRDARTHNLKQQELGHRVGALGRDFAGILEDRLIAQAVVLQVEEKLRLPAWLYYVDGLSQEEIAEVLDLSRGTVISRLEEFRASGQQILELDS